MLAMRNGQHPETARTYENAEFIPELGDEVVTTTLDKEALLGDIPQERIDGRKSGTLGTVVGWAEDPTKSEAFFVDHADGTKGAYTPAEMGPYSTRTLS
jgi:hypothetical protein